jgi:protease-4
MTKFLIGVLTGVILTGLMLAIGIFALAAAGGKAPSIASGSTLILRLEGDIPERSPMEFPSPFLERRNPVTVKEVWDLLRKAAADARIKAVVVEPRRPGAGWAKLQEIRQDLEQFKKSGKPLYAYLRSPNTRDYYLASAAEKIYMPPEDQIDVKGMRAELSYFRRTLDKLGVQVEIEHAGKYKDFGDTFTRTSMTPETREVMDSVLDNLYGGLVSAIAAGRKKSAADVKAILDEGPFLARQGLKNGLVDALGYEDEMFDALKKRLGGGDIKKVSYRDYGQVSAASLGLDGKHRIAFIVGEGAISRGEDGGESFSSDDGIGSGGFGRILRHVAADNRIKGVVVRIDSPGGDAFASDEIWHEMNALSRKKPTVISMSDAAASGGYYMAMTGDKIVAYPGTFTGSIGVVYGKVNLRGLYEKLGISKDILTRGRFADIDSDYKPMTEAERRKLREGIDDTYKVFVNRVAAARKRKFEEVEPLAQGRVWLGSQAKERGLVDELGGIDRAIELLKQKAGIGRDEKVSVAPYPARRNFLETLFGQSRGGADSRITALLRRWAARFRAEGGMMHVMPYQIDVD